MVYTCLCFNSCLETRKRILEGSRVCCLRVALHVLDFQGLPVDCLSRMILVIVIVPLLWMMWILLITEQGNFPFPYRTFYDLLVNRDYI